MVFHPSPSMEHRRLRPPDVREARGARVLLVWGDLPYWTVVDDEFAQLLALLDGTRGLDAILADHPAWQPHRALIEQQLSVLQQAGLFADQPPAAPSPPLYGTKIENVAINLTRRCNLRCRFCYDLPHLTADAHDGISVRECTDFLKVLRPLLAKRPVLTVLGGEPLLATEKLLALTSAARRLGFTTLVSTNGTLITEAFARQARRLGLQVQVSLDGHTAELHDAIRGTGAFQQAVQGVEKLVHHRVHTIISQVCHQDNLRYLEHYYYFAHTLGVNEARFIPLKRLGGAMADELHPVPLPVLLREAYRVLTAHPEFLPLTGRDAFAIVANTCRYATRRLSCGTGLQTVLLDADGTLYPCLNTNRPEFRLGSIREPDFNIRRLWTTSPMLHAVRQATLLHGDDHPHATCPVRYWCLAGCRGENHALTGDLANRPPHCAELRRGILDMCWMLAERPDLVRPAVQSC